MTGPKTNEGATAVGERTGTKAVARHIRSSAFKARPVLDLIRGLDVRRADEVLMLTERGIARDIRKVLRSAVANAVNNDGQDVDELFVVACFADEGSTLKRFRPRARGRATRIRKRTCHITVIVARMSDERLEILRAKAEGASASASAARRARVEASRQRAEAAKAAATMTCHRAKATQHVEAAPRLGAQTLSTSLGRRLAAAPRPLGDNSSIIQGHWWRTARRSCSDS